MQVITNSNIRQFFPDEGKHLKNLKTGEIYEGAIFPAVSLTEDDFSEVSEEEYQTYLQTLDGDEPTAEDYKQALSDLGVDLS